MSTIGIIEDYPSWIERWKEELTDSGIFFDVEGTKDIHTAERMISKGVPNLVGIILDACVPGNYPNTYHLAKKLKEVFPGVPIVAASSFSEYSELLMAFGATHKALKPDAVKILIGAIKGNV